jgi:hypothetical protein
LRPVKSRLAILVFAVLGLNACSDSTGPTALDPTSALHSLALGVGSAGSFGAALYGGLLIRESLQGMSPFVTKANVTIDGGLQPMYALALHEGFAPGACLQTIFAHSPHDTGCTLPNLGVALVLWQSHSADAAPDRLVVLLSDVGTSDFGFFPDTTLHPENALYVLAGEEGWVYRAGSLTSSVTEASTACGSPLPTFAKSGTCSTATFDEEGTITFANLAGATCCATQTITIPRQSFRGLSMAISEVQAVN